MCFSLSPERKKERATYEKQVTRIQTLFENVRIIKEHSSSLFKTMKVISALSMSLTRKISRNVTKIAIFNYPSFPSLNERSAFFSRHSVFITQDRVDTQTAFETKDSSSESSELPVSQCHLAET